MDNCGHFQAQLLDYLYDLLEADDLRVLQEHLKECGSCQTALARARAQQNLLAAAAKMECPVVRFEAPRNLPLPGPAQPVMPRRHRWVGWAVAAAGLLALLSSGGGVGGWYWRDYAAAKQIKVQNEAAVAQAAKEVQEAGADIRKTEVDRVKNKAQVVQQFRASQLKVVVTGPETVQPGAPNQYEIETRNLNEQQVPAKLTVRVRDAAKNLVLEEKDVASPGDFRLSLPPSLPLKPGTNLALEVQARRDGGPQQEVSEQLALAAPLYVTHLTTDKPMYHPGEKVYFRSLTLDRFSLKPPDADFSLVYTLRKSSGQEVAHLEGSTQVVPELGKSTLAGPDGKPLRGVGCGEFLIDPAWDGGEYTLAVSEAGNRFPPQERKFLVNKYDRQQFNKDLEWSQKSYGPGDEVTANCKVVRADGLKPVAGCQLTGSVAIDGQVYDAAGKPSGQPILVRADADGKAAVKFRLPGDIQRGQATLSVNFFDGTTSETINKPIPVVTKKLDVTFYPEGGELVAGVSNRVYFEVRSTLDKPADLRGKLTTADGKPVTGADGREINVETLTVADQPGANQGMGAFTFTPEAGKKYRLEIASPIGIVNKPELPDVKADGVVLNIPHGVTDPAEPISVLLRNAGTERSLLVGAYCRGRLMDHQSVTVKKGAEATVELKPAQEMGGVYRITVFEERPAAANHRELVPLAERLVYRLPAQNLKLAATTDRKQYIPGDTVKLSVTAADEKGKPAPAVVLVAVVDKSVITLADEKTARSMPTHFFLTTEVHKPEDLEHADFLLTSHPRAPEALDLLLGTQGWRRFAEQDPAKFRNEHPQEAERLLVTIGQSTTRTTDSVAADLERVDRDCDQQIAALKDQEGRAAEELQKARTSTAAAAAVTKLGAYDRFFDRTQKLTLPLLGVALLLAAFVGLIIGIIRNSARAIPYFVGAVACAAVLFLVLVAQVQMASKQEQAVALSKQVTREAAEARAAGAPGRDMPVPMAPDEKARERLADEGVQLGVPGGVGAQADMPPAAPAPGALPGGLPPPAPPGVQAGPFGGLQGGGKPGAGGDFKKADEGKGAGAAQLGAAAKQPMWDAHGNRGANGPGNAQDKAKDAKGGQDFLLKQQLQEKPPADADRELDAQLRLDGKARKEVEEMQKRLREQAVPAGLAPAGLERQLMDDEQIRRKVSRPAPPPLVVREYAHPHTSSSAGDQRTDWTETLCWKPVLVLPDGKGEVSFGLSDSVTTFAVTVVGHTPDGRIGSLSSTVDARLPFALEPKMPIEVNSNDKIDIPVSIANNTADPRDVSLRVSATGLAPVDGTKKEDRLTLAPEQRARRLLRFQPSIVEGPAVLELEGQTKPFATDSVRKTFPVVPEGFPVVNARSDMLEKVASYDVELPNTWVKGTVKLQADVYPSTLAALQKGLEALLREPGGCFEQTSTSNYPNLLILDYLKESNQAKPEVEQRAVAMLDRGYKLLTGYECPYAAQGKHGYEWFGSPNSAHEALTAYGLMEFRDMARVYKVDPAMLERTRQYLMEQRDGKGGFKRNPLALDTFGRAPEDITNSYIVWALTESGKDDDVTKELNALADQARTSKDPYFLSLVAVSLINRSRADEGVTLLKTVAGAQREDGHLDAGKTSITGSGGRDLEIETTALAVLGWLKANRPGDFNVPVQKAIKWIGQQRGGYGGFGSTQSTILALKALITFAKANKKTAEGGDLYLLVGDQRVGKLSFAPGAQDVLSLTVPDAEKFLKPGKNAVRVEITGDKNVFPCTVSWSYRTLTPLSADNVPVRLSTKLDRQAAEEGETVHLTVTVENMRPEGQGMAVAVIGVPAGLALPADFKQLKQHAQLRNNGTERGLISFFEKRSTSPRELVLYWRDLAPNQKIEVPIDLICEVPGEYRGPASRAYLYYNADVKHWVEPLQMTIKPKE
jgi:hypothetical protein